MKQFFKLKKLRKQGIIAFITFLSLLVLVGMMMVPKEPLMQIKMGVIRGEKSEDEYLKVATNLRDYLGNNYGDMTVSLHYYEEDSDLIEALENDIVQLAFVSGIGEAMYGSDEDSVVAAENLFEYKGELYPYYTAVFLKREYEGYDEFLQEDVSSLEYCILSSNSLAGYVFVVPYFENQEMYLKDMENVSRVENYAQGIELLANGTCDVSVGYLGVFDDYSEDWLTLEGASRDITEDLRVIYVSEKIYSSAVLVSDEIQSRNDLKGFIVSYLLENNYSESHFEDYRIIKERIQTILGGRSNE